MGDFDWSIDVFVLYGSYHVPLRYVVAQLAYFHHRNNGIVCDFDYDLLRAYGNRVLRS